MKLTKIHIENYGKIKDFDMTFDGGINQLFAVNGFGKTTLASFLKAMFYGLAPVRSNGKDFNDRRKFYPFSGGKFGGNAEFTANGDRYRIERFFGKKSDTDDELTVYKNGEKTDELSPVPGLKLFGLDEESFYRTLFIDSEISEITSTGTINGLLGEFTEGENGDGVETALSRLEAARKRYKAAKGNNDLISAAQFEITELKTKIENIEKEGVALADYYSEYNKLAEAERELSIKLKNSTAKNLEIEKRKTYNNLKSSAEAKLAELKLYAEKYPRGIPEKAETTRAEELITEAESSALKRESAAFSFEKKTRLQSLARIFADGKPSAEAFSKLQRTVNDVSALRAEVESLKTGVGERERELEKKFGEADVTRVLSELESAAATYREKADCAKRTSASVAISGEVKKPSLIPFVLFAVLIIAGAVAVFAFKNLTATIIGVALLAAGVVGEVTACVLSYGKNKNAKNSRSAYENAVAAEAEADSAAEAMRELIVPFGYYSKNGVMFDYAKFKSDADEYVKLKNNSLERERTIAEKTEKAARAEESVRNFLSRFSIDTSGDTLQNGVFALKSLAEEYSRLSEEQAESLKNSKAYADKESRAKTELNEIFSRYGLLADGNEKTLLKSIEADLSDIIRLKRECAELRKKAEDYREENGLSEVFSNEESAAEDTEEIAAKLNACRKNLAVKRNEISAAESVYETLADNKNRLESAEERLKDYKSKRNVIALAEGFLKAADDKIQQKYAEPIKNSFVRYMSPLEKALGEKIIMDKDFKMFFESGGEIRDDKHLSSGQRCILSLCFRLSLIENAFEGEKPFLIMDDPFVNLDEEHIKRVVGFIKEIAKNEQIIYLCCHESRKML